MVIKYLKGSISIKGLVLPNAVVRCMSIHGSELEGAWTGMVGLYGNLETAMSRTDFTLDVVNVVIMMDSYQPNNVEEKVNVFQLFLEKLKQMDSRFANFELMEYEHQINFTTPASISSSPTLVDPTLLRMNPYGAE